LHPTKFLKHSIGKDLLIKPFNIVASTSRFREPHAIEELGEILGILGDPLAEIRQTAVSGLLVGRTQIDPMSIPKMIGDLLKGEPWRFRYLLRVLPIEKVVEADLNIMQESIRDLSLRISEQETFRVTVEKRHNSISSDDIIRGMASEIFRAVDLSDPDWIVLVEVIQNLAGLSIIRPYHIFSTVVEMRKLGDKFI
jgi:tRNA acetyltransferase TAN1